VSKLDELGGMDRAKEIASLWEKTTFADTGWILRGLAERIEELEAELTPLRELADWIAKQPEGVSKISPYEWHKAQAKARESLEANRVKAG
jgi:hypothetical protein